MQIARCTTIFCLILFSVSTIAMEEKEKQLKDIMEKVAEGNDRISGGEPRAYLLLGNTGSGKSTLAHVLTKRKLQGIMDDQTGEMIVDALEPIESIRISHCKASETKIPNKCFNDDMINKCVGHDGVVIWDCPGFNDTCLPQEIANCFYIKKLFTEHKELKFILVASEGSMTADKGTAFVSILQRFCNTFNDVQAVAESVVLVITGVKSGKKIVHLKNVLTKILNENESLTPEVRKMIGYFLADKIALFHAPEKEGPISFENNMLDSIHQMGKFVATNSDIAKFSLSEKAIEYCGELLKISASNLELLVRLLMEGVQKSEVILGSKYDTIKGWLPSKVNYIRNEKPKKHYRDERFLAVKRLRALSDTAASITFSNKNNLEAMANLVEKLYNVFEEYVVLPNNSFDNTQLALKEKIEHFAYATRQMKDYYQLFSGLIADQLLTSPIFPNRNLEETLYGSLKASYNILLQKLKKSVVKLQIDKDCKNIEYYHEAIEILKCFPGDEKCIKNQAICNSLIASAKNSAGHPSEALEYYKKALQLDKTIAGTYNEIGAIYASQNKYSEAIRYYRVIENTIELNKCCKNLINNCPNDFKLRKECGDMWASLGMLHKAEKYYREAKSLSKDDETTKNLSLKIAACLKGDEKLRAAGQYEEKAKTYAFYDFSSLDLACETP